MKRESGVAIYKKGRIVMALLFLFVTGYPAKADSYFSTQYLSRKSEKYIEPDSLLPIERRMWDFGLNTSFGGYFIEGEKIRHFSYLFHLQANYLITDRVSAGLFYIWNRNTYSHFPEDNASYNNIGGHLAWYFYYNSGIMFFLEGGYIYGEYRAYRDSTSSWRRRPGSMARAGLGGSYFFGKKKRFGFQALYAVNFNLNQPYSDYIAAYPYLELGLHCYLRPAKQ
jgi:hypothetical protein